MTSIEDDAGSGVAPSPGPVPHHRLVEAATVRLLVAEQFPQWSDLPVSPVRHSGWDNRTFHVGDRLVARLPTAAEYALAVEKEYRWLPELARHLPLPLPTIRARGRPGAGYPHPWSVYDWLEGQQATRDRIADPLRFAEGLADVLIALRRVETDGGPPPGVHNWYRGGPLRTYDGTTRTALTRLAGLVDVDRAADVWDAALSARWDGIDVWFHGDLAAGNLLVDDAGRLSAVIDFGTCGVGDPACDLAIAWTLLTEDGRRRFRDRLDIDDASWARGRGWALWKTLDSYAGAIEDGGAIESAGADEATESRHVLAAILAEDRDPAG